METVIYIALMVLAFGLGALTYRSGAKAGADLARNKAIQAANPIKAVYNTVSEIKEAEKAKKLVNSEQEELARALKFNPDSNL